MKWQTHIHPRPVHTAEHSAGHTDPKRHRSNIPAYRFPPPVYCPAPCPSGKNRRHNRIPAIPDRSDTFAIRFAQPRQSGPSGMLPMVPLCRLIETRYSQNRISVKPAARFACPIDSNRFLTFRNPPPRHGKAHLHRISGTRQNGKTPPASCIDPVPFHPANPALANRSGRPFQPKCFRKKKGGKVQKTDGPTRHPQKKYRRENNEIHAQPAWNLASRILRQKRNNNPVFYDFLDD